MAEKLVLVEAHELDQLRLDKRRFDWLLKFYIASTGDPAGKVLDLVDSCAKASPFARPGRRTGRDLH